MKNCMKILFPVLDRELRIALAHRVITYHCCTVLHVAPNESAIR